MKNRLWIRRLGYLVTALWILGLTGALAGLGVTWIAGWRLEVIRSASMSPTIPRDSLAAVVPTDARRVEAEDVISFRDPTDRRRVLLHRVIEVVALEDGSLFFRTRGDGNRTPDPLLVSEDDVRGRLGWHVPKIGAAAWRLRPPAGLLVLVGLPVLMLVLGEIRHQRHRRRGRALVPVVTADGSEGCTELAILSLPALTSCLEVPPRRRADNPSG